MKYLSPTGFGIVLSLVLANSSFAARSCKATAWPFARVQSRSELFKQFAHLDRKALTEYYFFELSRPSKPSLAEPISTYLRQTELNADLRTFYDFLNAGAGVDEQHSTPKALKLNDICDVYRKVHP